MRLRKVGRVFGASSVNSSAPTKTVSTLADAIMMDDDLTSDVSGRGEIEVQACTRTSLEHNSSWSMNFHLLI